MQSIKFGNKKALNITSDFIKNDIKELIKKIGTFDIKGKYYNFLNKKNINSLKNNDFLVTLSTFGKKFILFLSTYKNKNYCIFINKKNDIMVISRFRFNIDLFNGTLFDGELLKDKNNNWVYIINDISYYKGENIITKNFYERSNLIKNILKNEYQNDEELCVCTIYYKEYFELKYIKDICKNYINNIDYKSSGLLFKNINNYSENYLYIFPECRSDIKEKFSNIDEKIEINNKNSCIFNIVKTNLPDIYELYINNNYNTLEKYAIAGVLNIDMSKKLKKLFNDNYIEYIKFECEYNKKFKKWIPMNETSENIDNIKLANSIQNKNS